MNNDELILSQLNQIVTDVRGLPKLEARMDSLQGSTQQLETAMRETTAALQTQSIAHSKLIDELRLQLHQSVSAMMGISNDVQSLMQRVKDLEKQITALFQQQMQLSKDTREITPAFSKHLDEYNIMCAVLRDIPERVQSIEADLEKRVDPETLRAIVNEINDNRSWMNGIKWFLRILFYALASAAVLGLLWLLGKALTGGV